MSRSVAARGSEGELKFYELHMAPDESNNLLLQFQEWEIKKKKNLKNISQPIFTRGREDIFLKLLNKFMNS